MPPSLDYDPISPVYDARYRFGGPAGVLNGLRQLTRSGDVRRIAEIGCGTGHWLGELESLGWTCGLDLSMGMLRKAQDKLCESRLLRADAHRIPLESESMDLLYCVNALHHFTDPSAVIAETARVLRKSGTLAVVGMDPQRDGDQWYLYDFFPGTLETDKARYPSTQQIASWMKGSGLSETRSRAAARIRNSTRGEGVFADPILHKSGTSQLTLLTDEAFRAGMTRIRSAIEDNPTAVFSTDVTLHLTVGKQP